MGTKSYCDIYIHLVWRTKFNLRILGGELELFVHQRLRQIGEELKLRPLAVESAWDHVHSFYRWHPSVSVSDAVRTFKSKTAVEWNKPIRDGERKAELLQWQVGYGAVSTRKSDVETVQDYIDSQKERHRRNEVWAPFERVEFDEADEDGEKEDCLAQLSCKGATQAE